MVSKIKKMELPEGWVHSRIGDFTTRVQYGLSKSMNTELKGVPILRMNNLDGEGFLDLRNLKYVDILSEEVKKYSLKKGDILFNRVNSVKLVGKTSIVGEFNLNLVFASYLIRVNVNPQNLLHEYLNYFMNSFLGKKEINRNLRRASGQANINAQELKSMIIQVPTIQEQQKIVIILSNVDAIIQQTQELIDQLQLLKKGLMQRFFTEGIDHTEFKKIKLGQIPKNWEYSNVGKFCKVLTGGTPSTKVQEYWKPPEIPWMKSGEIQGYAINKINTFISKLGLSNSSARIIPKNSVVIALAGQGKTRGRTASLEIECACNQSVACIVPNEKLNYKFLHYHLSRLYPYIRAISGSAGRGGLNLRLVRQFPLVVPSIDEQEIIAKSLTNLDDKILNEFDYKAVLQNIKKGLMQQLLTGKKRVPIN